MLLFRKLLAARALSLILVFLEFFEKLVSKFGVLHPNQHTNRRRVARLDRRVRHADDRDVVCALTQDWHRLGQEDVQKDRSCDGDSK